MDPNNSSNPNNLTSGAGLLPTSPPASPNLAPTLQAAPPPPSQPKVIVSSGSHKRAFLLGMLVIFLLVGLEAGIYLVQRQQSQDIRSKAAGCDMRWPAKPDTACGQSTQNPAEGSTTSSLTPNFHWDYGGYRTEDNGQCVQPGGCTTYSASIYLTEGSSSQSFARADSPNSATPVKDVKFSDFKTCDYGHIFPNDPNTCHTDGQPAISLLKPNTDYTWVVTPYFDGTVHAEQTWKYHFKTGTPAQIACQSATISSNTISPGGSAIVTGTATMDAVGFGYGFYNLDNLYGPSNPKPIFFSGNTHYVVSHTVSPTKTNTLAVNFSDIDKPDNNWAGQKPKNIQVNVFFSDTAGNSTSSDPKCVVQFSLAISSTAACQMVSADKDLTKIKIGDIITFSGWGVVSSDTEKIDKINFIITQGGTKLSDTTVDAARDTTKDSGTNKAWKGTQTLKVTDPGAYSVRIRVHWQSADRWFE